MYKYKVSIIVPVYNVEKYISKCLDSLVNQTLKDIEIVVINDGSLDNSQRIIDEYVKKYPKKVKSYIKENGGQGSARNIGYSLSKGEYIGYVDSDDYVELNMFEKLYYKAKSNNADIVICGSNNVYENNNFKTEDLDKITFKDSKKNAFFGRMAVWNKLYRKDILKGIEFRSKMWYEDLDFTLKAISNAKIIKYVNVPLYNYLIREGSTMNNKNLSRNLEILDSFDEIKKYNNLNKYKDIIEFLAVDHIFISASVRVINSNGSNKNKKELLNKINAYMNNNFKDYRNNKYLYLLSKNRKIVYKLLKLKLYLIIRLMFKLKGK